MNDTKHNAGQHAPPRVAQAIYRFSGLIILAWLAIAAVLSLMVPSLEQVEEEHAVSLSPQDAPSFQAMTRMYERFNESDSEDVAMLVLEGEQPLGDDAHRFYDSVIRQLREDTVHVRHIQDFWGDRLTRGAAQSPDGKAAYAQLNLAGGLDRALANESVDIVREVVERTPAPQGVRAYVTGPAAVSADVGRSGNGSILLITVVSMAVAFVMLLIVFRSFITTFLLLVTVVIQLQVARGFVAFLGDHGVVDLTTYVINLLVTVGIAAGTDYGIFFIGRYQESRQAGEDRIAAYFTTYRSVAKVVLASGLTISGAIFCLSFTRLPFFQPLAVPGAIGILVAVSVSLTLIPAVIAAGSRIGLFEPKDTIKTRRWRRIGTATVRWPGPIFVASLSIALVGLLALPAYQPSYSDEKFIPKDIPASVGLAAAARHFPDSRMAQPDILMIESDRDMRSPADMLVLEKLTKRVFAVPGVSEVQSITRPEGKPIEHTSIPYMMSAQSASQKLSQPFQKDRIADMLKQADEMTLTINLMRHMQGLMQQMVDTTHHLTGTTHELKDITSDLRDHIADFDDFLRPIRNYFYWEPHCFDIPACWALKSIFESLDGVDQVSDKMQELVKNLDHLDTLLPQMLASFPQLIQIMENQKTMMLTMYSTMSGMITQQEDSGDDPMAMGRDFDAAKNDDSFYLSRQDFENPDFQRVLKIFLSEDGKAARMLILQRGDPATPEGMSLVEPIRIAAEEALKGTPLESAKIYLGGTAAGTKDLVDGSRYDLLIACVAALCLIFIIMVIVTRAVVAALVIVGTVALSLGASFGLSVLVWQHLLGIQLHWAVLSMSVIVLLAVGSDYNLLLVSRMKEELDAGINTGIIRAMAGTGKMVTAAGLVFAFTMGSMVVSDLLSISQIGTTIGMGLLFDTLVVRAFMTPSIAALLGRWFWWPQKVRPRPASSMLRSVGPRWLVRSLLLRD